MAQKPDDWEKPRSHGQHLTEQDIATLKAFYRANKPSRDAAREVKCSSRVASKYYGYFDAEGIAKNKPFDPSKEPTPSRFYHSNFEL